MPKWPTTWAAVSAVATSVTGIFALVLVFQANRIATESQKQANIIQQQAQAAGKVYLGEAPPDSELGAMSTVAIPALAVLNTSSEEISSVWVVGHMRNDKSKRVDLVLYDMPSCTMYSIQDNVIPESVHFSDSVGHWRRPRGEIPKLVDYDLPSDRRQPTTPGRLWRSGVPYAIPNCTR